MNDIIESARDIDRYPEADRGRADDLIGELDRSLADISDRRHDLEAEANGRVAKSSLIVMIALAVIGVGLMSAGIVKSGDKPEVLLVLHAVGLVVLVSWLLTLPLEVWSSIRISHRLRNLKKVIEDKFGTIIRLDALHEQSDSGQASEEVLRRAGDDRSRQLALAEDAARSAVRLVRLFLACIGGMFSSIGTVTSEDAAMPMRVFTAVFFVVFAMAATWAIVSIVQSRRTRRAEAVSRDQGGDQ